MDVDESNAPSVKDQLDVALPPRNKTGPLQLLILLEVVHVPYVCR